MRPALALLICALAAGCGGERTFEAQEFVDQMNEHGAGLTLDGPLTSEQEGVEVFAVSFAADEPGRDAHAHGGGSLVLAEDAEAAVAEHQRCEGAVSFLCYRAANAVLILEDEAGSDEVANVAAAITALASE